MRQTTRNRGFTLIELLVALVVAAVILGFAIPNFTNQVRNNRSLAFGEEFVSALNYARSEAVKRGALVSICPSNDAGDACATDWTNGWLVFLDGAANDTDGSATFDTLLRYWEPAGEDMELTVERDGSGADFVRFTGVGALARVDNNPVEGTAMHKDCTGDAAREFNVSLSGSIRFQRTDC